MNIVHHVREKSQAKGSARTLLLNLAIYANDCCGVAWPSDATLYHETNVSRQRIHELKNALERTGELAILERPGTTNLHFVAWQGKALGGTSAQDPAGHDYRCPLRDPVLWDRCAQRWPDRFPPVAGVGGGSEIPDPSGEAQGSEISAGGSEFSEGGSEFSDPKTRKNNYTKPKTFFSALVINAPAEKKGGH